MGAKQGKSAPALVLKQSVAEQMLERDSSLQRFNTEGRVREAQFDSDGELIGADTTIPSPSRCEHDCFRDSATSPKKSRRRPSVTRIEVTRHRGKVSLRHICYQRKSKPQSNSTVSAETSARSVFNLSPRTPLSARTPVTGSPLLTPRRNCLLKGVDPSVRDLFVGRPPRSEAVTLHRTLFRPKAKEEGRRLPVDNSTEMQPDGLITALREVAKIEKSADPRMQRRTGVRYIGNIAQADERSTISSDPRLSALAYLLKKRMKASRRIFLGNKETMPSED